MKPSSDNDRCDYQSNQNKKFCISDKIPYLRKMKSQKVNTYSDIISDYYQLSIKRDISKAESDRIQAILKRCQTDRELRILLSVVDELTYRELGYFSPASLEEAEKVRTRTLEKILSGKSADLVQPTDRLPTNNLHESYGESSWLAQSGEPFTTRSTSKPRFYRKRLILFSSIVAVGSLVFAKLVGLERGAALHSLFADTKVIESVKKHKSSTLNKTEVESSIQLVRFQDSIQKKACSRKTATWTHPDLNGNQTAYDTTFVNAELTAAHSFFPPGSKVSCQQVSAKSKSKLMTKLTPLKIQTLCCRTRQLMRWI